MRGLPCRRVLPALDLLADRRLAEREAGDVRAHLATCDACRREYESLSRLRAALADQPRVEMRADALQRLQARLAAEGRPNRARSTAVVAVAATLLLAVVAVLPLALRSAGIAGDSRVAAVSSPAGPRAPAGRALAPGTRGAAGDRRSGPEVTCSAVRTPVAVASAAGPHPSVRSLRSRRVATWTGPRSRNAARTAPPPEAGQGSVVVVVVGPGRGRPAGDAASIALRLASIEGPDGAAEATVSMAETLNEDGSVRHLDYAYHPVEPEGTTEGPAPGPREERTYDGDDTQSDWPTGACRPGSGGSSRPTVGGAGAA